MIASARLGHGHAGLDLGQHGLGRVGIGQRLVVKDALHALGVQFVGPFGDHDRGDTIADQVVQRLEAQVGARLLQRTTRRVRLTPDGEQFLERAQELIVDADQLQAMFQPAASGLRGRLRIDLPNTLARDLVIPRLPEFLSAHPLLELGISTTDRRVDLVQEGFDCVLRVGPLVDADLVARPLGMMKMRNLASPAYLRTCGTPKTLADLALHRIVHYAPKLGVQGAGWEYQDRKSVV